MAYAWLMRRAILATAPLALAGVLALSACSGSVINAKPDSFAVRHHAIGEAHEVATEYCAAFDKSPSYVRSTGANDFGWPIYDWRIYSYECVTVQPKSAATTPAEFLASYEAKPYVDKFHACLGEAFTVTLNARRPSAAVEPLLRERCLILLKPLEPAMTSIGGKDALDQFAASAIDDTLRRHREISAAAAK